MKYLIPFFIFLSQSTFSQTGCTDPLAENYDENAIENDGSCIYESTVDKPFELYELKEPILESSGLLYTSEGLWTHNDSGNKPILYLLDSASFDIKRKVVIQNATNRDWEDLAMDGKYFYIGDFGNNEGDRKDLKIYRILRDDLLKDSINADIIEFYYPDQIHFDLGNKHHNFDCEAFFASKDSLHLFTKNWENHKTRHYTLPKKIGSYPAILRDSFDVKGLITAADMAPNGVISLLGYEDKASGTAFQWLLFDYKNMDVFSGNKRRLSLGSVIERGQVEGLAFSHNGEGFISSEDFSFIKPKIVRFTTQEWTDAMTPTEDIPLPFHLLTVFPNPFIDTIHVVMDSGQLGKDVEIQLVDIFGKVLLSQHFKFNRFLDYRSKVQMDGAILSKGTYFLKISSDGYEKMVVLLKS